MARDHRLTLEILEHLAETIEEMTLQIDGNPQERMIEITEDTPETVPLTDRISDRYTIMHRIYFSQTVSQ